MSKNWLLRELVRLLKLRCGRINSQTGKFEHQFTEEERIAIQQVEMIMEKEYSEEEL